MATMRYVVQLPALVDAPIDEVVRLYAPAMQRLITP